MEKILNQILTEVKSIKVSQDRMESQITSLDERQTLFETTLKSQGQDILSIKKDVKDIKTELGYAWDDIKKIDSRLTIHDEELVILKRLK